jgi:nitroimidazol reductase NimA-like FMN-containing flavoprotein (pyridoxamine 5'-phosphate oxidase superfamily)
MWTGGRLVELSEEECWELLGEHHVGRIIWCGDGRPHVVPVNFAIAEGQVWVRSTPYSHLALECRDRPVAFEVDEIDD